MTTILTITITGIIVYFYQEIKYRVFKPVAIEQNMGDAQAWKNFIEANIDSCFTTAQCFCAYELIKLFSKRFKNQMPVHVFADWIENLSNRIDTRYKVIKREDEEMSELTIDQLVN